jgi:hypothetical protein
MHGEMVVSRLEAEQTLKVSESCVDSSGQSLWATGTSAFVPDVHSITEQQLIVEGLTSSNNYVLRLWQGASTERSTKLRWILTLSLGKLQD